MEYENGDEIIRIWNPIFLILSILMSFTSTFASVRLLDYVNWKNDIKNTIDEVNTTAIIYEDESYIDSTTTKKKKPIIFGFLLNYSNLITSIIFGYGSIWLMHLISTFAITLDGIPVCFDWRKTTCSLVLSILFIRVGLYVVSYDIFANNDKHEKLESLLIHDRRVTDKKNRRMAFFAIHSTAFFYRPWYIIAGGIVAATGALIVQYLETISKTGPFAMEWSFPILIANIILAVFVGCLIFFIIFRVLRWKVQVYWLRPLGSAFIALALCSVRYCGEYSVRYLVENDKEEYTCESNLNDDGTSRRILIVVVAVCVLAILSTLLFETNISREIYYDLDDAKSNSRKKNVKITFGDVSLSDSFNRAYSPPNVITTPKNNQTLCRENLSSSPQPSIDEN